MLREHRIFQGLDSGLSNRAARWKPGLGNQCEIDRDVNSCMQLSTLRHTSESCVKLTPHCMVCFCLWLIQENEAMKKSILAHFWRKSGGLSESG